MSKTILMCGFVLIGLTAMAQKVAEDIRKINEVLTADELYVSVTYSLYADSVSKKPIQVENGKWVKSKSSQYHAISQLETIRKAGELQVVLDHENKVAVISNAPVLPEDGPMTMGTADLQEVLDQCRSVKYKAVDKVFAAYDLYPLDSEFSRITVVFDRKSFQPRKMILYHGGPQLFSDDDIEAELYPRMEIEFKFNEKASGVFGLLELNKYVVKKGNDYQLTAPYKQYQLNNYLLTN